LSIENNGTRNQESGNRRASKKEKVLSSEAAAGIEY